MARRAVLAGMFLALHAGAAVAQDPPPAQLVEVGVWFNDVHSIDFVDGSLGAEFYMWWVSTDEAFRPFEVFQVLNGRDWSVRSINRRVLSNGRFHTSGYVSVIVNHDWDLHYFPFDRQRPELVFEMPYTASEMRLAPNQDKSVLSDFAQVEGFDITGFRIFERVQRYETDFGMQGAEGEEFSRLVVELDLTRDSRRPFIALFVGFIMANLVALLTYAVHVSMLSTRTSMSAGAIFGAVGNMYFLQRAVHPAAGSVLIDRVAIVTFGGIVVALLTGIVVDRIYRAERLGLARIVNWTTFALVLAGSLIYLGRAFGDEG